MATARAGNVIGGGDWAQDRVVPDCVRAWSKGKIAVIRNPRATRPWQHVLEPLRGYIAVAEALFEAGAANGEAWNFGPEQSDAQPVEWIVRQLAELWGRSARWEKEGGSQPHEAKCLKLDWSKAEARLGWRPALRLKDALAITAEWYKARLRGEDMRVFTGRQIQNYEERSHTDTKIDPNSCGVGL